MNKRKSLSDMIKQAGVLNAFKISFLVLTCKYHFLKDFIVGVKTKEMNHKFYCRCDSSDVIVFREILMGYGGGKGI